MATTIQATQISTNTSSWYQSIRKIQAKTNQYYGTTSKMTQTSDPAITAGSKATATHMNNFLTALNALQNNTFLAYADWSKKVTSVTAGSKISSTTKSNIDATIASLKQICSNYATEWCDYVDKDYDVFAVCTNYSTENHCPDHHVDSWNSNEDTRDYAQTVCSTDAYNNECGDYSNDGTWAEEVGNMTYNQWESCQTQAYYPGEDNSTNWHDNSTYDHSPYGTEGGGYQVYGHGAAYSVDNTGPNSNASHSNDSTWSYDGWDYNVCSDNSTYSQEEFNATADYSRSAESCDNCDYWDNGNSTYDQGTCNQWSYAETFYTCYVHGQESDATNNVATSYGTWTWSNTTEYSTYNVSGNSVYSN